MEQQFKDYITKIIKEVVSPVTKTAQKRRGRVDNLQTSRRLLQEAVNTLPSTLRAKGWNLVQYLDQNKTMLSPLGEFIPFETKEPITGSHINQLLLYALRKSSLEPVGWSTFYDQLKTYKIRPGILSKRHQAKHIKTAVPMDTTTVEPEE